VAKQLVQLNNTSRTEYVWIQDSSSSTGAGLTGLTYLSAGLTLTYVVERGTAGSLALANLTSASVAWATGGFVAVDASLMPGLYRLDIPNVVFATADKAVVMLKGAANMVPVVLEYQIVGFNPDDAVRLGLTALPSAAAGAAGGLPTGNASGQVTVAGTATGAITSTSFAAGAIDASAIATDAITSAELSTSAVQEIADSVLSRKLNMAGSISDVSVTSISSATFTGNNTYVAGDTVQFLTSAPASFTVGTKYYVISTSLTATTFQLSASLGGTAITTASTGAFTVVPIDDRTVRSALRYMRNKVAANTATMTVYTEDDTTTAWTSTITADASAAPITISDPA